jgi:hypothetical protein
MKISLTIDEVKSMVATKMGLGEGTFDLSISYPSKAKNTPFNNLLQRLIKIGALPFPSLSIEPSHKIQAIREFRQFYLDNGISCGLGEAKCAIEEWPQFFKYATKNGLPTLSELECRPWRI